MSEVFVVEENWHDLALFSVALDTMLRANDLLGLRVADVCYQNGQVRSTLGERQGKTKRPVYPALTKPTEQALAHWIKVSGKTREAYLFTRFKTEPDAKPISRTQLSRLVKMWAAWLGQPPERFACHSLRRTKGLLLYREGVRVADISRMYGHSSEASTMEYLGIDQERVTEISQSFVLTAPFKPQEPSAKAKIKHKPPRPRSVERYDPKLHCPNAVALPPK